MDAMLVASLPMYDLPWLRDETDALWQAIAARLRGAGLKDLPDRLTRGEAPVDIWHNPNLMFGQTCGYPYARSLRGVVRLIGTPCYTWRGCTGPMHCSLIIARQDLAAFTLDGMRGMRLAINSRDSNTGMNLLRLAVAELGAGDPFFGDVIVTQAHLWSMAALRTGSADVAAVDCVTYGLVAGHRPDLLEGIAVIGETVSSPALPFVMSTHCAAHWLEPVRAALQAVVDDPALSPVLARLGLGGIESLDEAAYEVVLDYERRAVALGHPVLR